MSIKEMSEYIRYSKYAQYNKKNNRRDNWREQVQRMFNMHKIKYNNVLNELQDHLLFAQEKVQQKYLLGSQRALQFSGDAILKKEAKIYNCTASYADRVDFFKEAMYLLLCGAGVGFSVQYSHTNKLPQIKKRGQEEITFVVPDSIEGWADALNVLLCSYFNENKDVFIYDTKEYLSNLSGKKIKFDFSQIRPKGSPLSWGGKAPGHIELKNSLLKIENLLDKILINSNSLRPIDVYDIVMHSSDAVLSGGVRRSATICLFSQDDNEMMKAKTGNWMIENPQRARSNNSVLLLRDSITKEKFNEIIKSVKEFGEPGFIFADNIEFLVNPCCEIGLYAYDDEGNSGWQMCNLCEINMKKCDTEKKFLDTCVAASILGTIQAGYTNIDYLGPVTKKILERESLLGISMTGMMDNPKIAFDPEIQKKGAEIILATNKTISKILNINECARATCIKPAGTTSLLLQTSSGIHPHHAKRYFRRIQANDLEFPAQIFKNKNPLATEKSVWSSNNTDLVLTFLCEVPNNSLTKNNIHAIDLLNYVKLTQNNWVKYGNREEKCVKKWLKHNVSNTITVLDNEWQEVENFIFTNKDSFTGISLLSNHGDKDYPQAPFCTVLTPEEIVNEYGNASIMASGLIVDGLSAFDNNLWKACNFVLENETLININKPVKPILTFSYENEKQNIQHLLVYSSSMLSYYEEMEKYDFYFKKIDWIRRAKQFAQRYFDGDLKRMTYCLKDVHNWKTWCDLKREYKSINWSSVKETDFAIDVSTIGAQACSGGSCEINF